METSGTSLSKQVLQRILGAGKLKYCFERGICTIGYSTAEMLRKHYNVRGLLRQIYVKPEIMLSSDELSSVTIFMLFRTRRDSDKLR